jgi:anti-sigma factor RsiW
MTHHEGDLPDAELQSFVDGRMPVQRMERVARRLAADPLLAEMVAAYRQNDERLRTALTAAVGDTIPARLLEVVDRPGTASGFRRRAIAAVAAGLIAGGASIGLWAAGTGIRQRATIAHWDLVAAEAIHAHRMFAKDHAKPVDIAGVDRLELSEWLARQLGQPRLVIPDLQRRHFRLLGARLLPAGTDTAVLVMYENTFGERLSFYARNGQSGETVGRWLDQTGTGAFYWVDDGCSYVVTGLGDRRSVEELGRALMHEVEGGEPSPG